LENKVVITGLNIISSLGLNRKETWEAMLAGKSGVRYISLFDASGLQTRIAAEVSPAFEELSKQHIKKRMAGQMTRVTRMAFVCAKQAMEEARLDFGGFDRKRCAVIMGIVNTGNSSVEKETTKQNRVLKSMTNAVPAWISLEYKLEGPNFSVNTACAASAYAIGLGYDMIRSGQMDLVIAGGADSIINPEEIEGFNELYALSTNNDPPEKASRPFSANRDGFVIGEGAGVLILESETSARKRGAGIFAELAGYAISSEGYNIMAPQPDGAGMAYTMEQALRQSGITKEEIDYINAHGTSTTLNDLYETMAIKKVFGERAYQIPVSGSKSMIGHTIGAAGAIEGAITALSIKNGILTPTINYDNPDPDLDLDYVPNQSRSHPIRCALSNSFGFGGHNAILVMKKFA